MTTAYDLVQRRDDLQKMLDKLSLMTNGPMGKQKGIWDVMSHQQNEIRKIDRILKSITITEKELIE